MDMQRVESTGLGISGISSRPMEDWNEEVMFNAPTGDMVLDKDDV